MTGDVRWDAVLLESGARLAGALAPRIAAADADGRVTPRSQLLCAALGQLAVETYRALGGARHVDAVQEAAALLALLTKIDDERIDGRAFHGGAASDRVALRRRTEAALAPTLASIRAAAPVDDEPRCQLAAEVGRRIDALAADRDRADHLRAVIAAGWAVQVDAVEVFTASPAAVDGGHVRAVTAAISGYWLWMIALFGTLPADAARPLSAPEAGAFQAWGLPIQRADALADLAKDQAEGLIATEAGWRLWRAAGASYLDVCGRRDADEVYRLVAAHDVDRALWPTSAQRAAAAAPMAALGGLPGMLDWILGFLLWRYTVHPLYARPAGTLDVPGGADRSWARYHDGVAATGATTYPRRADRGRGAED